MSSHDDDDVPETDEAHEVFDDEPVQELAEGEPQTPLWLPLVGAGLFLLFGLYLTVGDDETAAAGAAPASASAGASAAPVAARPSAAPPAAAPRSPRPALSASPEQIARIRENLRKVRAGGSAAPPSGARPRPPARPPARPAAPAK